MLRTAGVSLGNFASQQLRSLLNSVGLAAQADNSTVLLSEILGPGAQVPCTDPRWPSDVADDHSPVEYSTAFTPGGRPAVRVIIEPQAETPGPKENLTTALEVLEQLVARYGADIGRFHELRDLFLPEAPQGRFGLWYALVINADGPPAVKVYFNPDARGEDRSSELVREALARVGLGPAWTTLKNHALRRDSGADRCSFFAIDLIEESRARVKVYVSHEIADESIVRHAAEAVDDVDDELLGAFCEIAGGGSGPFTRRPLISSYTFLAGDTDRPSGYSLYVPVRDYVEHDLEAQQRVLNVLTRYGLDHEPFERALDSVARRPLDAGVGLIAHVSLRMGRPRPGVTTYLSSEAYSVTPARSGSLSSGEAR